MISEIEQEFSKLHPKTIKEIHDNLFEDKKLEPEIYDKLVSSYEFCLVGNIRDSLGLNRKYSFLDTLHKGDINNYCKICRNIATILGMCISHIQTNKVPKHVIQKKYLWTLEQFKKHLKEEHGKDV